MKTFKRNLIIFIGILYLFSFFSVGQSAFAANERNTIAYKLALIHQRALSPLDNISEPSQAMLSEFKWIMQTLKGRCINPENALADTIIQAWQLAKKTGSNMSLLDVARELTVTAKNIPLFGAGKVNFRMTTNYWAKEFIQKMQKGQK